ncbi:MAG: cytidine deaminase [Patescibacteria group bacterium]|nr:cytidine deaminase [Patescibacteria group bacterium]
MQEISNKELIEKAKSVINTKKVANDMIAGDVGCALVTDKGNVYVGVCIDLVCGLGFCAESAAIANMITNGEYRIKKLVAYGHDTIMYPCGRCRELIHQVHKDNIETEIIVKNEKVLKLKDLLPYAWEESWCENCKK